MGRAENGAIEGAPEFLRGVELPPDAEVVSFLDIVENGLTGDDVVIRPAYSDVRRRELSLRTRLTRNIEINSGFLSAAMSSVTEKETAIAIAREGGVGVIHKNLTAEEQAAQVASVKRAESALIEDPISLSPEDTVGAVQKIREEQGIGSVLITEGDRLVGLVTKRQLRFVEEQTKLREVMKPLADLPVLRDGSTKEEAERVFQHDVETDFIPVVDEDDGLVGLYTYKDVWLRSQFPRASKDARDRLLVGAAVGVERQMGLTFERVGALMDAGVDFVTLDSAHGHDEAVIEHVRRIKQQFPDLDVVAGNVATREATRALIEAGADAVKVGIGPGASCTTRKTTGVGVPQLSAVVLAAVESRGEVPIIADGGMRYSGDVAKALVAGADSVMMGSVFAGVEESPSESITLNGRKFKAYYGMGSERAIEEGAGGRYFSGRDGSVVPEGIEGVVPYRGTLAETMEQFKGGIEKAMYYTGSTNLDELRVRAEFVRVSPAAEAESHPHTMTITKEAANYSAS